jgi:hypothetical protein
MTDLSPATAANLVRIALGHVGQEYPSVVAEVMNGPADVALATRDVHPIFYGSLDWHSCVHGYWLLSRLNRLYPGLPQHAAVVAQLDQAFTPTKVATEMAFFTRPYNETFERPYGWVWLMKLAAELRRYDDPAGRRWAETLSPLARDLARRLSLYIQRLSNPVRGGLHNNTAFTMALAVDYADAFGDQALVAQMRKRAIEWFGADAASRHDYGGVDFLSPNWIEALAMRRLLPAADFRPWLDRFLPGLAQGQPRLLLEPARIADRTDATLAHLDGVNLVRAWAMRDIAKTLADDPRGAILTKAAGAHLAVSIDSIDGHYAGQHWLSTYALLALEAAQGDAAQ